MTLKTTIRGVLERIPGAVSLARLTLETTRICLNYRVTGLAAEGAFFMLLSLPPLVLGIFGGFGYVGQLIGPDAVERLVAAVTDYSARFLSDGTIDDLLLPTVRDVLRDGRPDLISVGFLLALWSGSRALNVFVDTISIMYGQGDERGILRQRFLTFGLYSVGIVVAVIIMPLVLLGPAIIEAWLPEQVKFLTILYWPIVLVLSIAALTTLFHIATPRRAPWWRNLPGALLALTIWLLASLVVRSSLEASLGGSSIYGPLSTPIVLLIWLYALAIAILIGAALNAGTRVLWPVTLRDGAGTKLVNWAKEGAGGLLTRGSAPEVPGSGSAPGVDVADGPGAPIATGSATSAASAKAGDVAATDDQRARDRQYARRERSALAEAIERELNQGMGRPRDPR